MIEKRKQVYVVDDDPDDRFLICEGLRQVSNQISIIEAVDGIDLFEIIGQQEPQGESIVLLDVNMPRMNGLETLEKIRSEPSLTGVPVVMFSTSNHGLIKQMQLSAIDTFVQKPNTFEGYIALATQISSTLSAAQ